MKDLDPDKAYILGLLHDIGRGYKSGYTTIPEHIFQGYQYAMKNHWNEVARICMTHSYPIKEEDFNCEPQGEEAFIKDYIVHCTYDDYDKLIQLCDSLAIAEGFCLLEKRFIDVARRYGLWDTSVARWNALFEIKESFEQRMGCSIYDVLPGVKDITFIHIPLWKPN